MRRSSLFAAVLLAFVIAGCGGGGGESPTSPGTSVCAANLEGNHLWAIRGGCSGGAVSLANGVNKATFNSGTCVLTMDVTPTADRDRGGKWLLTADLRAGTGTVTRSGVECPATDIGSVRVDANSIIADMHTPASSGCSCILVYTLNVTRAIS